MALRKADALPDNKGSWIYIHWTSIRIGGVMSNPYRYECLCYLGYGVIITHPLCGSKFRRRLANLY